MMKLCDTSVLVDIDRGGVDQRIRRLDDEGRHAISAVTVTELRLGVNKRYDEQHRRDALDDLERLLARFDVVDVSKPVATAAANIITQLREHGQPLDDLHDVYVAAAARANQLAVLTANVKHFERIDGVEVVDWTTF